MRGNLKRLSSFFICIIVNLCIVFTFVGCSLFSDDSSFKIVSYVKLTSGGKEISFYSQAVTVSDSRDLIAISESEFNNAPEQAKKYSEFGMKSYFSYCVGLSDYKTIDNFHGFTAEDYGSMVYFYINNYNIEQYYKHQFLSWEYVYVHVKIISDKKLVVYVDPLSEPQATTYEVTSYSVGNELK